MSDAATSHVARPKLTTWLEIAAVMFLVCAPSLASAGRFLFWLEERPEPVKPIHHTLHPTAAAPDASLRKHARHGEHESAAVYDASLFEQIVTRFRPVPIILFVMWISGEGWARFGCVKPRWSDLLLGAGLWLVVTTLDGLVAAAFHRAHPWFQFTPVDIPLGRAALIAAGACVVGFAEELAFRAYLITRLEKMLGATWMALALSVLAFGFVHLYKGEVGAVHSLVAATVWGVAFCLTRRIWPLVVAHAITDFVVIAHVSAAVLN